MTATSIPFKEMIANTQLRSNLAYELWSLSQEFSDSVVGVHCPKMTMPYIPRNFMSQANAVHEIE